MASFQTLLQKAVDDVESGRDNSSDKQRILDINDRVREETARRLDDVSGSKANENDEAIRFLTGAVRKWVIGTILLGSGAEHLDAATKRRLAASLVELATSILNRLIRIAGKLDFSVIKAELVSDKAMEPLKNLLGEKYDEQETKRLLLGFADLLEYSIVADPFHRLLGFLCEQARHRVLAPSVEHAGVAGIVQKLIHGTWLTDIDSQRGRRRLLKAIRDLPPRPFLRVALATHYISRVYWHHSGKANRLTLLDAAEEALKPLSASVDKGQIRRLIEREAESDEAPAPNVQKRD
jgi:hypothetical protein